MPPQEIKGRFYLLSNMRKFGAHAWHLYLSSDECRKRAEVLNNAHRARWEDLVPLYR